MLLTLNNILKNWRKVSIIFPKIIYNFCVALLSLCLLQVSFWYKFPSVSRTSLSNSCRTGLLAINSISLTSCENFLISPSFMNYIFPGYRILYWQFFKYLYISYKNPLISMFPWIFITNLQSFESLVRKPSSIYHWLLSRFFSFYDCLSV